MVKLIDLYPYRRVSGLQGGGFGVGGSGVEGSGGGGSERGALEVGGSGGDRGSGIEFLLMKRAQGKIYAGQWRMVGGKVELGESHWMAARREFEEETRLSMRVFWTVPSVNQFYEYKTDTIYRIPVFAAELEPEAEPVLNDEHTEYRWVSGDHVADYVLWPEQQRLMGVIERIVSLNQILPEWTIEDHR
jgi:dATP pyrophosphohydrolase